MNTGFENGRWEQKIFLLGTSAFLVIDLVIRAYENDVLCAWQNTLTPAHLVLLYNRNFEQILKDQLHGLNGIKIFGRFQAEKSRSF